MQGITVTHTLEQIESEIKAHSQYVTASIIAIGNALIEAKGQLVHGDWEGWLTNRVNFSQRTANNFMRIAREISAGSSLSALPYTKVLALLDIPAEQREQAAVELEADTRSAAALKKAIADRKKAEEAAKEAERKAEAQSRAAARANDLYEQLSGKFSDVQAQLEAAKDHRPDVVEIEKPPADYEDLKAKAEQSEAFKRRAEQAERYAEQQEAAYKQAQSSARRMQAEQAEHAANDENEPYSPQKMGEAVRAFMGAMGGIPNMSAYFFGLPAGKLEAYRPWLEMMRSWVAGAEQALSQKEAVEADAIVM